MTDQITGRYERAYHACVNELFKTPDGMTPLLCHGGGRAWLYLMDVAIDVGDEPMSDPVICKESYYKKHHGIVEDRNYNIEQAKHNFERFGHAGPWGGTK